MDENVGSNPTSVSLDFFVPWFIFINKTINMARKKKTIHYLYKTTCLVTGRYYIGMHSTNDLDDGYMGSGKRLRYSIRKHGVDNHKKEVLEFFDSRELLVEAEKGIISEDMINDPDCMNLCEGGTGGHGARFLTKEQLIKGGHARAKSTNRIMWVENKEKYLEIFSNRMKSEWENPEYREKMLKVINWEGRKHSEETKKLMSDIRKGKGIGENNSQYGTCWVTNGKQVKKIKKEDLDNYLNDGWKRGRK